MKLHVSALASGKVFLYDRSSKPLADPWYATTIAPPDGWLSASWDLFATALVECGGEIWAAGATDATAHSGIYQLKANGGLLKKIAFPAHEIPVAMACDAADQLLYVSISSQVSRIDVYDCTCKPPQIKKSHPLPTNFTNPRGIAIRGRTSSALVVCDGGLLEVSVKDIRGFQVIPADPKDALIVPVGIAWDEKNQVALVSNDGGTDTAGYYYIRECTWHPAPTPGEWRAKRSAYSTGDARSTWLATGFIHWIVEGTSLGAVAPNTASLKAPTSVFEYNQLQPADPRFLIEGRPWGQPNTSPNGIRDFVVSA